MYKFIHRGTTKGTLKFSDNDAYFLCPNCGEKAGTFENQMIDDHCEQCDELYRDEKLEAEGDYKMD